MQKINSVGKVDKIPGTDMNFQVKLWNENDQIRVILIGPDHNCGLYAVS
jgi:hypothetical protein